MKSLQQQLVFYRSYHRTFGCKVTHLFGVPLVTFALLIPMGWVSLPFHGFSLTLAMGFVLATLVYYFFLSTTLASLMSLIMLPIIYAANRVSDLPFDQSILIFVGTFSIGAGFQLIGHAIEGKKPALLDNFRQAVFTAPLFLLIEGLNFFGWKGLPDSEADTAQK